MESETGDGPLDATDPRTLVGVWDFDRVVTDRLAAEEIVVVGTVDLTLAKNGEIRWSEQGTMTRSGSVIPVTRVLFLRQEADGWTVTFEDGRDFHPWRPGVQVEHLCGRDTYRGLVSLVAISASGRRAGEWSVTWHVSGPTKNYAMFTRMTQQPNLES